MSVATRKTPNGPRVSGSLNQPVGIIEINQRLVSVSRWVTDQVLAPVPGSRRRCLCGNSLCVNPKHWATRSDTRLIQELAQIAPPVPENLDLGMEWSMDEVEELVSYYFNQKEDEGPVDRAHPLLSDIPERLLNIALKRMNKL